MALRVSINLPGDTVITLEADEPGLWREVVDAVLKELPQEILRLSANGAAPKETPLTTNGASVGSPGAMVAAPGPTPGPVPGSVDEAESPPAATGRAAEEAFGRFCRRIAPTGDMRRTVVAAEGAKRYLGAASVAGEDLGRLFDLAGWMRPADFLQTLRNAARNKFGWVERVPGRSGHYVVTAQGRAAVIGPPGQ